MAVPSTIADLTTSEATNSPADSETVTSTTRPSDYLRAHAAIIKTHTEATAEHGATGAVVGTTNTQTLTNKTLTAPVINGTVTTTGLTLPAATVGALNGTTIPTSKTLLTSDDLLDEDDMASNSATDAPSQQSVKAYVDANSLTSGTAVASTSGTAIDDFTGIPSGTKQIMLVFSGVSTNSAGSANIIVQLGDGGGIEDTSYTGIVSLLGASTVSTATGNTSGFHATAAIAAAATFTGTVVLTKIDGNTWVANTNMARTDSVSISIYSGVKTLSAELDRLRITTTNGTDAFDAGTINILYQ